MNNFIAVEGLDGAGKNTFTKLFTSFLSNKNCKVANLAFPNYQESVYADLSSNILHNQQNNLSDNTYLLATLFALDRFNSKQIIIDLLKENDFLIVDRYIASNIAYSLAKNPIASENDIKKYLEWLELDYLKVPKPNLQILLRVSPEQSKKRAISRSLTSTRKLDKYETDKNLQENTWENYNALATQNWVSPWEVVDWDENTMHTADSSIFPAIYNMLTKK